LSDVSRRLMSPNIEYLGSVRAGHIDSATKIKEKWLISGIHPWPVLFECYMKKTHSYKHIHNFSRLLFSHLLTRLYQTFFYQGPSSEDVSFHMGLKCLIIKFLLKFLSFWMWAWLAGAVLRWFILVVLLNQHILRSIAYGLTQPHSIDFCSD